MSDFYSVLRLTAAALVASVCLASPSFAQAPPSGEAPRMAPDDSRGAERSREKKPLLTIENRQAILSDLYGQLAGISEPEAAKPLVDAIAKVWNFSGSATSDLMMERARAATEQGGFAAAAQYLSVVTELQPDYAQGWFLRALTFKLRNDSHRMLGDLRRVLALDPKHFDALKALAFELNERGERKMATEAYNKLLQAYPAAAKSSDPVLEELNRALAGQGI